MTVEEPEDLDLDATLEPVHYPSDIETVGGLLERALFLAGADPEEDFGPRSTDG
ncbi:MAG TPA: hypothetical protein VMP41_02215 [Acidimicrobiales bacterium]|nr:hypothetical protein [Acidimicrobiales bacterium]